jgi:hypothetical protein
MGSAAVAPPPAYIMYPLGRGWRVLRYIVHNQLVRSHRVAARWIDHAASIRYLASERSWFNKGMAWLLITGFHLAAWLQYLPHIVLAMLLLTLYPLFLLLWFCIALLGMSMLVILRMFYVKACQIRYHCPACYRTMPLPAHLCPTCQTEHARLQPGIFGVLSHRCKKCETRLPTLDLLGRRQLARICPHCHDALSGDLGRGPAIHIALVGAGAAGKTSYLVAALQELKQSAPLRLKVAFTDTVQENNFEKDLRRLKNKQPPATAGSIVPRAWTLKMQLPLRLLPRLLYLYDPAGEAFKTSAYTCRQEYYSYSHGIIFVIDPLSIPALQRWHMEASTNKTLPSPSHPMEVMQVYERMMQMFEISAGLNTRRRYPQPVAVVLTKADALQHHNEHFIRALLCACGLDNFVRDLESHFTHVRYFSCSALQDLPTQQDASKAPASERLLQPLLWLLKCAKGI